MVQQGGVPMSRCCWAAAADCGFEEEEDEDAAAAAVAAPAAAGEVGSDTAGVAGRRPGVMEPENFMGTMRARHLTDN